MFICPLYVYVGFVCILEANIFSCYVLPRLIISRHRLDGYNIWQHAGDEGPFCENPVCHDPVWKPVTKTTKITTHYETHVKPSNLNENKYAGILVCRYSALRIDRRNNCSFNMASTNVCIHPVSIRRFKLRRLSPGAGLLRNYFVHR